MTIDMTPREIMSLPMWENDAEVDTVGEYLTLLLTKVIEEEEGFDSKRPFGNSGWKTELFFALRRAGLIVVAPDDGRWDHEDEVNQILAYAIKGALQNP